MILIYLYIVARAKVMEMFAHLKYIQEFITPQVRISPLGFLLATYKNSLFTLLDNEKDELGRKSKPIDLTRTVENRIYSSEMSQILSQDNHNDTRGSIMPNELYENSQDVFVKLGTERVER